MDLPPSRQEDTGADPAFKLFGKQIKGPYTKEIKEELSPRGVDERGISFATSSDEEEDLNTASAEEATWEDAMAIPKATRQTDEKCNIKAEDPATQQCHTQQSSPKEHQMRSMQICAEGNPSIGLVTVEQRWGKRQSIKGANCSPSAGRDTYITQRELKLQSERQTGKQRNGLWSRCPRCNSTDTKFCYFNNYNVNQPRHFCKHCQRYWTAGGVLRNVPIGAGKRKNKHMLHKEAFFMNSASCTSGSRDSAHSIKTDSSVATADILHQAQAGSLPSLHCPIPETSATMVGMQTPTVDTDLVLSAHQSAQSPATSFCIQSQLTTLNIPPHGHRPHLSTSQQLQKIGLPSRSAPIRPILAQTASKISQQCPDLPCVPPGIPSHMPSAACGATVQSLSCPDLALYDATEASQMYPGEFSKFSRICPNLADGPHKSGQLCPKLAGLSQIGPHLPHLQSELSRLSSPGAHLPCGSSEPAPTDFPESANTSSISDERGFLPESAKPKPTSDHQGAPHSKESISCTCVKAGGDHLQHENGLSFLRGPNLWPYFYTYWLNNVASLGCSHLNPINPTFTPQGWAFPFIPSSLGTLSSSPHPSLNLEKFQSSHTRSLFTPSDGVITCSISSTPRIATSILSPTSDRDTPNGPCDVTMMPQGKRSAHIFNHQHYSDNNPKCLKSES